MKRTPLVILHGWNLNSAKFEPLVKELKMKKFEVLCPDLPGFGKMPLPGKKLELDDYVLYVISYLDQHKIKKADLICHSFGGRIGIKLAVFYPERINKLVLTGVPGIVPVPRIKILFFLLLAKLGKLIFSVPPVSIFKEAAQKLIYRAAKATDFYNTDAALRETFQAVVKERLEVYLKRIKSPTLLLWGANDTLVPLPVAEKMKTLIPGSILKIEKSAAHAYPFSNPEIFVANLEGFLEI